jgi:hypothetical protein
MLIYIDDRIWIYLMKIDRSFIRGNFFVSLIMVLNGVAGQSYSFFYLTTIVGGIIFP